MHQTNLKIMFLKSRIMPQPDAAKWVLGYSAIWVLLVFEKKLEKVSFLFSTVPALLCSSLTS